MIDREKVFDAFRNCITEPKCRDCPWEQCEQFNQKKVTIPATLALDVLNLLKEQQEQIDKLIEESASNAEMADGMKELLNEQENDIHHMGLIIEEYEKELKKQEAVEPKTTIMYNGFHYDYCGNCSRLLPVAQDFEKAKFCPSCGKAVKWE